MSFVFQGPSQKGYVGGPEPVNTDIVGFGSGANEQILTAVITGINTKNTEQDNEIAALQARVPGALSANLLELDAHLRNTVEQTGSVRRKQHWIRSADLNITNVANRTGTLAGDTTGLAYSDTTHNLTGWGTEYLNTHLGVKFSTSLGGSRHSDGIIVLRRAVANTLYLFLSTGPDSKLRIRNTGSTGVSNDQTELLYVAQLDSEGVNDGHIIPEAGDQLTVQARHISPGGDSIQFVGSYYRASTNRWYGWNPHNIASGRSEFSLNEIHIDGGGDINRLSLAESDTVLEHNTFIASVRGDEDTPVAWGTRIPATTTTVQTYDGPFKFTGKVELGPQSTFISTDGTTEVRLDSLMSGGSAVIPGVTQIFSGAVQKPSNSLIVETGAVIPSADPDTNRYHFTLTNVQGTTVDMGEVTKEDFDDAATLPDRADVGVNHNRAFLDRTVGNQTYYLMKGSGNKVELGTSGGGTRTGTYNLEVLKITQGTHTYQGFDASLDRTYSGTNVFTGATTLANTSFSSGATVNFTGATISGLPDADDQFDPKGTAVTSAADDNLFPIFTGDDNDEANVISGSNLKTFFGSGGSSTPEQYFRPGTDSPTQLTAAHKNSIRSYFIGFGTDVTLPSINETGLVDGDYFTVVGTPDDAAIFIIARHASDTGTTGRIDGNNFGHIGSATGNTRTVSVGGWNQGEAISIKFVKKGTVWYALEAFNATPQLPTPTNSEARKILSVATHGFGGYTLTNTLPEPLEAHLGVANILGSTSGLVSGTGRYTSSSGDEVIRFDETTTGNRLATGMTYNNTNGQIVLPAGAWLLCASGRARTRGGGSGGSAQNQRAYLMIGIRQGASDYRHISSPYYPRWAETGSAGSFPSITTAGGNFNPQYQGPLSVTGAVISDGTTPITIRILWTTQTTSGIELQAAHLHCIKQ